MIIISNVFVTNLLRFPTYILPEGKSHCCAVHCLANIILLLVQDCHSTRRRGIRINRSTGLPKKNITTLIGKILNGGHPMSIPIAERRRNSETKKLRRKTSRLWEQAANFFIQWWKNHWFCQSSSIHTLIHYLVIIVISSINWFIQAPWWIQWTFSANGMRLSLGPSGTQILPWIFWRKMEVSLVGHGGSYSYHLSIFGWGFSMK